MSSLISAPSPEDMDFSERAARISESVLADFPEAIALAARRCVILHWFDQPVVAALLPEVSPEQSTEAFEELTILPFIEPVPGGFAYHALTRQGLLHQYARERPELLITACKLAIPAYADRTNDNQAIAEAFFCTLIAGETESAAKVLDDAYKTLSARGDWAAINYWFSLQDEAESLPFVKPLPRDFLHWLLRSIVHYLGKDFSATLTDLAQAIELGPDDSIAYFLRGNTYRDLKNYEAALADYGRALGLDPNLAQAYNNRGNTYRDLKNYEAALADYGRALDLDPNLAQAFYNRGNTYSDLKNYEAALADYETAIRLDPSNDAPVYNTACSYALQGDVEQACNWLRKAIAMSDKSIGMAQTDSDFDAIRDTPEFQALLQEFASQSG